VPTGLSKYADWWSHALFPGYDFNDGRHPTVGYYASAVVGTLIVAGIVAGAFFLTRTRRRRSRVPT